MNNMFVSIALPAALVQFAHLDRFAVDVGEEERHAHRSSSRRCSIGVVRVSSSIFFDSWALVMNTLRPLIDVAVALDEWRKS